MSLAGGPRWPVPLLPLPTDPKETVEALVELARQGDGAAFERLYQRYEPGLRRYLDRLTQGRQMNGLRETCTEEMVQETFLKAWVALPKTRPGLGLKVQGWLYLIATNLLRDAARHASILACQPWEEYLAGHHPTQVAPERTDSAYDQGELSEMVQSAMNRLPTHFRLALVLRDYRDLSYPEIAAQMGTTRAAIKSIILRARRALLKVIEGDPQLRERLAAYGYRVEEPPAPRLQQEAQPPPPRHADIQRLRESLGWTRKRMAEQAGVSRFRAAEAEVCRLGRSVHPDRQAVEARRKCWAAMQAAIEAGAAIQQQAQGYAP